MGRDATHPNPGPNPNPNPNRNTNRNPNPDPNPNPNPNPNQVGRHIDGRHNGMGVALQRSAYGKGATLQGGISIVRRVLAQARDEHMS